MPVHPRRRFEILLWLGLIFQLGQPVQIAQQLVIPGAFVDQFAPSSFRLLVEDAQMAEIRYLVCDRAAEVVLRQPQLDDMPPRRLSRRRTTLSRAFGAPVVAVRPAPAVCFAVNGPQCRSFGIRIGHRGLHDRLPRPASRSRDPFEYDGCRALL